MNSIKKRSKKVSRRNSMKSLRSRALEIKENI